MLSIKTLKLRHKIVKLLAPKLYEIMGNSQERTFVSQIKNQHNSVGVEIGVHRGENAFKLLSGADISKLYLIDPYDKVSCKYFDYDRVIDFSLCVTRLKKFSNKIKYIKMYSNRAKNLFSNGELDFVYIDGDHSFKGCLEDIRNYFPLIKKHGIIGGHDFCMNYKGVTQAVIKFCNENNIDFQGVNTEWWIRK